MTLPRRVLLTGAAGRLGTVLRGRLAGRFELLRLSDVRAMPEAGDGEEVVQCDLADAAGVDRLCDGMDAVLHFGGIATDRPWHELMTANIAGAVNVFEAALKGGCERVLFASSNHVVGLYPTAMRLDAATPPRPDSAYGASKAFGESLAAHYAYKHGLRSFSMRIGTCRPAPDSRRALATWLSYGDLDRLVMAGLTADYLCETVYGVSRNSRSRWDNANAYRLGYDPIDDAERHAGLIEGSAPDEATDAFHGGSAAARDFGRPAPFREVRGIPARTKRDDNRTQKLYDII